MIDIITYYLLFIIQILKKVLLIFFSELFKTLVKLHLKRKFYNEITKFIILKKIYCSC